jgi:hypothetical protein
MRWAVRAYKHDQPSTRKLSRSAESEQPGTCSGKLNYRTATSHQTTVIP